MVSVPVNALLAFIEAWFGEGTTSSDYSLGLSFQEVVSGVFGVVKANMLPILGLMGVMLGVYLAIRFFRKAKKGSI